MLGGSKRTTDAVHADGWKKHTDALMFKFKTAGSTEVGAVIFIW